MLHRQTSITVVLAAATCMFGACQNSLRIDVELIQPSAPVVVTSVPSVASTAPSHTSLVSSRGRLRFIEGVIALGGVGEVMDRIATAKQALRNAGYGDKALAGPQFAGMNRLEKEMERLQPEIRTLEACLGPSQNVSVEDMRNLKGVQLRANAALTRGLAPLDRLEAMLRQAALTSADPAARKKTEDAQKAVEGLRDLGATAKAGIVAAGFGGFRSIGVHQINPADPAYRHLLSKARSENVGAFTSVQATAVGDSTIVFVQETPTQLRVFEIDNDPTQLIQNVAYIMDKALEAAVKYSAP